jgi:4-hydroxybenzoate polyprenyltransferase
VWERTWGAISLVHPFPTATVVLMSAVLIVVARQSVPASGWYLRAVAAVFMTQVAIGALNELVDRESDAAGQPSKPIPSGRATAATAVVLVAAGLIGTVALGATFGPSALAVLCFATSGGLAYDLWLKPTPFSIVGYLIGFLGLITWIWYIAGHLTPRFALVYPLGVVAILTAHLAQSLPDIETDRERGHRGLAAVLGVSMTLVCLRGGLTLIVMGSLALAALAHTAPALALAAVGTLAGLCCLVGLRRSPSDRRAREALFRGIAVTIALLAVAALISLNALGA